MITCVVLIGGIAVFLWYMDRENKKLKEQRERMEEEERCERERKEAEDIKLMNDLKKKAAKIEVMKQAKMMGDTDTYDSAMKLTYHGKLPELREDGAWTSIYDDLRILKIAGMNYRGNLSAYVGQFKGVLVPEPKNEYDPFAIMVKVEDGKHVGYIKEEQTGMVRTWVGAEQLGFEEPTIFKPYRVEGFIDEREDEDGRKYYDGCVYLKKNR